MTASPQKIGLAVAAVSVPAGAGLATPFVAANETTTMLLLIGVLLVALISSHVFVRRRTGDDLSVLSLCAAFYFVAFVVGGIFTGVVPELQGAGSIERAELNLALALVLLGWFTFAAGYMGDLLRFVRSIVPPPAGVGAGVPVATVVVPLLAFGWLARVASVAAGRYFHIPEQGAVRTGTSWFIDTGTMFPLLALALVGAHSLRRPGNGRLASRTFFWILLAAELAWSIPTGARGRIVSLLLLLLIVHYYTSGRLPSRRVIAIIGIGFVFVVFPLEARYRADESYRTSLIAPLRSAVFEIRDRSVHETASAGVETTARLSDIAVVARLVDFGPDRLDLPPGGTLRWAAEGFVPRALYPEKAEPGSFGNTFGRAYGFVASSDLKTAVAITQPGELYLNGGWLALVLGMPIVGAAARLVNEYLRARRRDVATLAIYALVAPALALGLESTLAVGFVGAIKIGILFGLVIAVVSRLGGAAEGRHRRSHPAEVVAS